MSEYKAPLNDMYFLLFDVFEADKQWQSVPSLAETIDKETAVAILEEGAKLIETEIAPGYREADEIGVSFNDQQITTPEHYKRNFAQLAEGGWIGLTGDPQYGGMGMPKVISAQYEEMLCAGDVAFSLYPGLTTGASLALHAHGSDELKDHYLPRMYSGQWTGTMCLTEPHAGTDLGMIKTKAVPSNDGSYQITGTKIFITSGEHDLTENIVHLVLAKLPDAPSGSKGISLFLVPKFLSDEQGNLTQRNSASCGSIEKKMGIHASSTCVMNFDQATGYLVGEENRGLAAMFVMMNYERLGVGIQGLGCGQRSYVNALNYALERIQSRSLTGVKSPEQQADPIWVHGDVKRMLLNMKSLTEAGRAFSTYVAMQLDTAKFSDDAEASAKAESFVGLLTPVAKAFLTDMGMDVCILGQQIFGGHGYIREWGQEQLVRDTRIAQIYEGTNGIQAMDLIGRKVAADGARTLQVYLKEITEFLASIDDENISPHVAAMGKVLHQSNTVITELLTRAQSNPDELGAAANDFLHLVGYISYGYMWLKMMKATASTEVSEDITQSKMTTGNYYFSRVFPRTQTLLSTLSQDSSALFNVEQQWY